MTDFANLYDGLEEYILRRDPESYSAQRIALEVKLFKIHNFLKILPEDYPYRSIVEIGCATGEIIATFPGIDINRRAGIDISRFNIKISQQSFPEIVFKVCDFRSLTEKFDLVILSDILEHVPNDVEFLRDAVTIGNIVLVNLPLEKCLFNAFRRYGPEDSSGHLRNYFSADSFQLLEASGLTIINYCREWSFENEFEFRRQELNKRMWGKRFSGGMLQRTFKAVIHQLFLSSKQFRSITLPINLFVATRFENTK